MKKKEWYNLLDEYNDLVKAKKYNEVLVDAGKLDTIKKKILHYLQEEAGIICEADAQGYVMSLAKQGLQGKVAEKNYSDSWIVTWAKKADNIITFVNEERLIEDADIEDSYYRLRFFNGKLSGAQYLSVVAACVAIIYVIALITR